MCFDADSHPPITPIAGGALDSAPLILTSEDGAAFRAFRARATEPSGAGILILPDVRGLHTYYEELALRYAERGVDAVAIDYFGRTAGTGSRGDDFEYRPHVEQTRWEALAADIRTGLAALRAARGGATDPMKLFTTGFCMGGRLAFLSATMGLGLSGVIGFYGWPVGANPNGTPAPADLADSIEAPVLAIYGGGDERITPEIRATFDAALDAAGVEHRTIVYPNAPHSFFDRKAADFAAASAGAWDEALAFIGRHTA
jgi:carboxymethylenebutenolidase